MATSSPSDKVGSGFYKNFQSPELLPLLWKQLQNTCTLACKTQIRFEKLETYIIDLIDRPAGEIRVRLWSNCSICRTNREEHPEDLLFLLLHEWKSCPNAGLFTLFEVLSSSLYWRPTLWGRRLSITRICHNMPNPQEIRSFLMLLGQKGSAMFSSAVALGERNSLITLQTDPPLQQIDANRRKST